MREISLDQWSLLLSSIVEHPYVIAPGEHVATRTYTLVFAGRHSKTKKWMNFQLGAASQVHLSEMMMDESLRRKMWNQKREPVVRMLSDALQRCAELKSAIAPFWGQTIDPMSSEVKAAAQVYDKETKRISCGKNKEGYIIPIDALGLVNV